MAVKPWFIATATELSLSQHETAHHCGVTCLSVFHTCQIMVVSSLASSYLDLRHGGTVVRTKGIYLSIHLVAVVHLPAAYATGDALSEQSRNVV